MVLNPVILVTENNEKSQKERNSLGIASLFPPLKNVQQDAEAMKPTFQGCQENSSNILETLFPTSGVFGASHIGSLKELSPIPGC